MSNKVAGKAELHRLVDTLTDLQAAHMLEELQWMLADEDTLTESEAAEAAAGAEEIARGDYVTLDDIARELDRQRPSASPELGELDSGESLASTSVKDEIHHLVDDLDEHLADEVLDYLRWLTSDEEEELTDEEYARVLEGEAAIARGEFVTFDELKRSLGL